MHQVVDLRCQLHGLAQADPESVPFYDCQPVLVHYDRSQCIHKLIYYFVRDMALLTSIPFLKVGVPLFGRTKVIEVPGDTEIVDWVLKDGKPYRWFLGMIATHELSPQKQSAAPTRGWWELSVDRGRPSSSHCRLKLSSGRL